MPAAPESVPGAAPRLILASASPQRREILTRLGLEFEVVVSEAEEVSGGDPETDVRENARLKAAAVAGRFPDASIIACDTDVVDEGRILGKPSDEAEARDYLRRLSGRTHEVISALVIVNPANAPEPRAVGEETHRSVGFLRPPGLHAPGEGVVREGVERSFVTFRELDEGRIDWYVGTGEWRGRAGGYAIQGFGSALVAGVEGDLSNVIGLPVPVLVRLAPEIFP